MILLDYSNLAERSSRPLLGRAAAFGTVCWALGLNFWLIRTAQIYFLWNQSWCGTAAVRMHEEFFLLSPWLVCVAGVGLFVTRLARAGQLAARLGFLASIAGWCVAAAFIHWGYLLQ